MAVPIIKALIDWDYDLNNDFKKKEKGYTFVIDVWEAKPKLALYKFTPFMTKCDYLEKQPPLEMMMNALEEQGTNGSDGVFKINPTLRNWIESNILEE
ncbi:DVU0772 family protein [Desulforamulus aquiferis]|uniref:Uncharacterized protein n=1 Tax=Desulforamulus aquiferis TaxID=1397668 RepID=A0AAW7Z963_9FIRM|nr:hypothetical protein [Desulforamulus aquiferis]MDO7786080.1 hypothetical protein [Desulforamulus aquiferis]RYD05129.1 hypothetical protein N752_11185 [Desulforamulus aquiferis]